MRVHQKLLDLASAPHRPRRTVRLRLTLLYGTLFVVCGALLLALTYGLVRHSLDGLGVPDLAVLQAGNAKRDQSPATDTDPGEPSALAPGQQGTGTTSVPEAGVGATKQLRQQAKRYAALLERQRDKQLQQLLTQSGIALATMTLLAVALGWLVAGRILRPLRTITTAAQTISATDLHKRLALNGPDDELKRLGDTFDQLLDRLERSFQAQRSFVANASHELRTPLARQHAVAQVALADPNATVESLRAVCEDILECGDEQERLIDAFLTLTQSQAGLARKQPLDLAAITRKLLSSHRVEVEQLQLHVQTTLHTAPTTGDSRLVERLIENLIDNALRHNKPSGAITISTRRDAGHAVLEVTNDGPTIPPTELERLFLPLERLETSRISNPNGLGLGLSIVQAVADAHDALLTAHARPGGGLHIEVRFAAPIATPDVPAPFGSARRSPAKEAVPSATHR